MDTYVAMHREYTESYPLKDMPIVINGYGGPGAGKSTACMEITAELKSRLQSRIRSGVCQGTCI